MAVSIVVNPNMFFITNRTCINTCFVLFSGFLFLQLRPFLMFKGQSSVIYLLIFLQYIQSFFINESLIVQYFRLVLAKLLRKNLGHSIVVTIAQIAQHLCQKWMELIVFSSKKEDVYEWLDNKDLQNSNGYQFIDYLRMSEVEETLNRMQTHKNVQGIVVVNSEGSVIRTTYQADKKQEGNNLARLIPKLVHNARSTVRDLDSENQLKFIRLKTAKNQILIAPDNQFILIVVQGQRSEQKEEQEQ